MRSSCHPLVAQEGGELVERAQVDAARQAGQLVRRHAEAGDHLALLVLERPPLGVVVRLGDQAADQPVDGPASTSSPALFRSAATAGAVDGARAGRGQRLGVEVSAGGPC